MSQEDEVDVALRKLKNTIINPCILSYTAYDALRDLVDRVGLSAVMVGLLEIAFATNEESVRFRKALVDKYGPEALEDK